MIGSRRSAASAREPRARLAAVGRWAELEAPECGQPGGPDVLRSTRPARGVVDRPVGLDRVGFAQTGDRRVTR